MRRSVGIIAAVLLLALVGVACLMVGLFERRMAIAQEDTAVLDFVDPQAEYVALEESLQNFPWVSRRPLREIHQRRAMLQYWQGDYTDLVEVARTTSQAADRGESVDQELQTLAANALYRVAQRGPQDRTTLLKNLDLAIRAYSETLRAGSERPDVAFNYELAIRLRGEIAAGKRKGMPNVPVDEDKTEPNMHGNPGEPPKDMKVEQFQIRVPMDPRDIKNSQEQAAGTGQQRRRRG
jgi:hypothetical protein